MQHQYITLPGWLAQMREFSSTGLWSHPEHIQPLLEVRPESQQMEIDSNPRSEDWIHWCDLRLLHIQGVHASRQIWEPVPSNSPAEGKSVYQWKAVSCSFRSYGLLHLCDTACQTSPLLHAGLVEVVYKPTKHHLHASHYLTHGPVITEMVEKNKCLQKGGSPSGCPCHRRW